MQGTDGNLYGTTDAGGSGMSWSGGCGTVFQITTAGVLTDLHNFDLRDGEIVYGGLVQHTNGTFYGITGYGGANGYGTVFSLDMGRGPYVKTVPTSGKAGATVGSLGTGLTGATSVAFNGTAATFTIVSDTYITSTIPAGATTGPVQVVTPSGTCRPCVDFSVR